VKDVRTRLDIAYLGTSFEGWQVQSGEREGGRSRTVQGTLEACLERIYRRPIRLHGAGRTDAGVHAHGQVAHFELVEGDPAIPAEGLQAALNSRLPEAIRIHGVREVPEAFHARLSATAKTYRYRYRRGRFLPPHEGLVEALLPERVLLQPMKEAAELLVGRRDFALFSVTGSEVRTTVRTLFTLEIEEEGPVLVVTAIGDGFLRGMVRRLAGTLREVGRGATRPRDVLSAPGPTAEARGLTLEEVTYGSPPVEEPRDDVAIE